MIEAVEDGWATATTDGGHPSDWATILSDAPEWVLSSPGNLNWPLIQDFASVALNDLSLLGKAVVSRICGIPPRLSVFYGGSTGGRQAHQLAQRYPTAFNGIVASQPAIHWDRFIPYCFYPQLLMNLKGEWPDGCQLNAITEAAIVACDKLDGIEDGIVTRPDLCKFDPKPLIGKEVTCDGSLHTISPFAVELSEAVWAGATSSKGERLWYGVDRSAALSLNKSIGVNGLANTECDTAGVCKGAAFTIGVAWIRAFVAADLTLNVNNMTRQEFDDYFQRSVRDFRTIIGTDEPDLRAFARAGGKMFNWHGVADELIPVQGSIVYRDRVMEIDPEANDYYRLFLVPGAGHGFSNGAIIRSPLPAMLDWLEKGIAPESLRQTGRFRGGPWFERDVCLYPKVQTYVGGDPTVPESFQCTIPSTRTFGRLLSAVSQIFFHQFGNREL